MVKAISVFPASTAYRLIEISGFLYFEKGNLFRGHWKVDAADLQ